MQNVLDFVYNFLVNNFPNNHKLWDMKSVRKAENVVINVLNYALVKVRELLKKAVLIAFNIFLCYN